MSHPHGHSQVMALMREVLGEQYTNLQVRRVTIVEDLVEETTSISCEVVDEGPRTSSVIEGKGAGAVDALFRAMQTRFAEEYPSLKTIRFANFSVTAHLETKKGFSGTDSKAEVAIEIANSDDKRFSFSHEARSIIAASIVATLRAVEYFINSERAFVSMYHARKDAEGRNRSDLVQRYTDAMATLVKNTSYSEVIGQIKSDIDASGRQS